MNNNHHQQNFFMGALLGGLAGATAMLLFTPLSGERLRSRLMNGIGLESMMMTHRKRPSRSTKIHVMRTTKTHKKPASKRSAHKVARNKRAKTTSKEAHA